MLDVHDEVFKRERLLKDGNWLARESVDYTPVGHVFLTLCVSIAINGNMLRFER